MFDVLCIVLIVLVFIYGWNRWAFLFHIGYCDRRDLSLLRIDSLGWSSTHLAKLEIISKTFWVSINSWYEWNGRMLIRIKILLHLSHILLGCLAYLEIWSFHSLHHLILYFIVKVLLCVIETRSWLESETSVGLFWKVSCSLWSSRYLVKLRSIIQCCSLGHT